MKEGEIHTAIRTVFNETRMVLKLMVFTMFQYKETTSLQQSMFQDPIRNLGQLFQCIRGVCKNEIELLTSATDIFQGIGTYRYTFVRFDLTHHLTDESMMMAVLLNRHHTGTATRNKFNADAAGTSEKIQCRESLFFKIKVSGKHIEKILFGEIGCRTCLE